MGVANEISNEEKTYGDPQDIIGVLNMKLRLDDMYVKPLVEGHNRWKNLVVYNLRDKSATQYVFDVFADEDENTGNYKINISLSS